MKKRATATLPQKSQSKNQSTKPQYATLLRAKWFITCAIMLLIALMVRLPFFGQVPDGLNRDEAGLGYNAYSLLKTGADEYGLRWPVSITSFGDQKLPGYVYLLIPFIAKFGLTIWSVRLPSLLAGVALVFEMGCVGWQVGRRWGWSSKATWILSTLSMLFIAVSPWANHFSRLAYEANVALTCFVLGFIAYQAAIHQVVNKIPGTFPWRERGFWILAAASWSATLLTYHSYQIFVPLMCVAILLIDWRRLLRADRIGLGAGILIGVITVGVLFGGGVIQANVVKDQGITPFRRIVLEQSYVGFRNLLPSKDALYSKVLFNAPGEAISIFSQNYLTVFSAEFFFVHGSGHGDHDPGDLNNMHLYIAPLLLLGIFLLWSRKKNRTTQLIIAWMLLAAVPAALTIQPQHEIRLSQIFPVLTLIAAIGCTALFQKIKLKWLQWLAAGIFLYIVGLSTLRTSFQYLYIVPSQIVSNERYHLLAKALIKYQPLGLPIITNNQQNSPYIWYLFESKYNPATYNQHVERYAPDGEGFIHVKQIDNIYFENINWDQLQAWAYSQRLILILAPNDVPADKLKNPHIIHVEDITTSNHQLVYQVWEWNVASKIPTIKVP